MKMKINKCDFSYFCAIAAPEAAPERFRTLCDWGNWVSRTTGTTNYLLVASRYNRIIFINTISSQVFPYDDSECVIGHESTTCTDLERHEI
jgi:hypothetical protein